MNNEVVLTNAKLVTPNAVIEGSICLKDGVIHSIDESRSQLSTAFDMEGDYLLPGLVELHTDNLERHFNPRPGVTWPALPAVLAHDALISTAGITTVLNAVSTGALVENSDRIRQFEHMVDAVRYAGQVGATRAEHLLHIRCEITYEPTLENLRVMIHDPLLRLVSVMDHSPGQRQFVDLNQYWKYWQGKYKLTDAEVEAMIERQTDASQNLGPVYRREIAALCQEHDLALASHDDATEEHIDEAVADNVTIAEFPTTIEAAEYSRKNGLHVLMGAPNVVRGFSHSGNISARKLAELGLLDTLSSDYAPVSLLHAAFVLEQHYDSISLPQAVAMITKNPADAAGLHDRGELTIGKRADLVQVKMVDQIPVVGQVWREAMRVV